MIQTVVINTESTTWGVTNAANVTASSFTQPVPKTATPSGDGVIGWGNGGAAAGGGLLLCPYGVGSDGNTFLMSVFGWRQVQGASAPANNAALVSLWVPVCLATFTGCTIKSALPGVANTQLGATQFFCAAMTLGVGNSGVSVEVVSPGTSSGQIAHAVVSAKGFKFLEVQFSTGGVATSCNALWARV